MVVGWTENHQVSIFVLVYLHPSECLRLWSEMSPDHMGAFRASVLLTWVIICNNVLCPVLGYLYNNRYAGWVKCPPPFISEATGIPIHVNTERETEVFRVKERRTLTSRLQTLPFILWETEQRQPLCSPSPQSMFPVWDIIPCLSLL